MWAGTMSRLRDFHAYRPKKVAWGLENTCFPQATWPGTEDRRAATGWQAGLGTGIGPHEEMKIRISTY